MHNSITFVTELTANRQPDETADVCVCSGTALTVKVNSFNSDPCCGVLEAHAACDASSETIDVFRGYSDVWTNTAPTLQTDGVVGLVWKQEEEFLNAAWNISFSSVLRSGGSFRTASCEP
jgi:hypothetical protein